MESYTIRKRDGKLEGPYSLRVIKAFIIAGKLIEQDTLITSDGELPLAQHQELRSFWEPGTQDDLEAPPEVVASKEQAPVEGRVVFYRGKVLAPGPGPTYAGNFSSFSVVHLLYRLFMNKETGRLHIRHNRDTADIFVERGKLTYAVSNEQKTWLGEILKYEKMLSPEAVTAALEQSELEDRPLGQVLLSNGSLSHAQVHKALNIQFKQRLFAPLGWGSNTVYRFYRNQITGAQFPIDNNFYHLMQEAVFRWTPENVIKERLLHHQHRRVARMIHPKVSIEQFDLQSPERKVYQNIINRAPLIDVMGDITETNILSEEQAARTIFLLWQFDLLHLKEEMIGSRTQQQLDRLNTFIHQLNNQNRLQRLGLKGGASAQEIRQAYLNLAREYHPDLLPPGTHPEISRKMSEAFALIADAYSVLTG